MKLKYAVGIILFLFTGFQISAQESDTSNINHVYEPDEVRIVAPKSSKILLQQAAINRTKFIFQLKAK